MSDTLTLIAGETETATLVRMFGADLAVVRIKRNGVAVDMPVHVGLAQTVDGYGDNWRRRIDAALTSGVRMQITWVDQAPDGLPRLVIHGSDGQPIDTHAVRSGWAVPRDTALASVWRKDYAKATTMAYRSGAGLWSDQDIVASYHEEMAAAIPEGAQTWNDYGVQHRTLNMLLMTVLLVALAVRFGHQKRVATMMQEAAERDEEHSVAAGGLGERMAARGIKMSRGIFSFTGLGWLWPTRKPGFRRRRTNEGEQ